jgi:hypothetical protein
MTGRVRPYLFYDIALTICSTCFRKLEGKIVFENSIPAKNLPATRPGESAYRGRRRLLPQVP